MIKNNKNIFWVDYSTFSVNWENEYRDKVFRNIDKNFKELEDYDWVEKEGHNEIDFRFTTNNKSMSEIVKMAYKSFNDEENFFSKTCEIEQINFNYKVVIFFTKMYADIIIKKFTNCNGYLIHTADVKYGINKLDDLDKVCEELDRLENKINKVDSFIKVENKEALKQNKDEEDSKAVEIYCNSVDDNIKRTDLKKFFKEFDNLEITRRNKRFLVYFRIHGSFTAYLEKYCNLLLFKKTLKYEGNFEIRVYSKALRIDGKNSNLTLRLFNSECSPISLCYYDNGKVKAAFYRLNNFIDYIKILNILFIKEYGEENKKDNNYKTTTPFLKVETKKETPKDADNTQKQIALINEFIEFTRQKIKEARKFGAEDLVHKFLIEIKNLKQMIVEIKTKTDNKVIYLNYSKQLLLNYKDSKTIEEIERIDNKIETIKNKIETIKKETEILESYKNFIESKKRKIKRTFTDKNDIDYLVKSKYIKKKIWNNTFYKIPIAEFGIVEAKDYKKQLIKRVNLI